MKARIKGTNIIVECKGIGTLVNENKGIKCKNIDGSIEVKPADCLIELGESFDLKEPFNWEFFRNQAAKDILCAMIHGGYAESRIEHQSALAVRYATELVKQLKEKEEKLHY